MAVNHYFQAGRGIGNAAEKRLHEDVIIESLKIFGQDIYYLPRTLVNRDLVMGEDTSSRFDDSYLLEMYFENNTGFAGENELINKFGLEIRDDTTLVLLKGFFEIQFVEDQEPFYQLGNLPVYKLRVTRWEYASEKLDTGQGVIDQAEDKYTLDQLAYKVTLEYGQEVLTGAGSIMLEDYHDYSTGQPSFLMNEDYVESNIQTQSPYAGNLDLNTEAGYDTATLTDDILDFTERNPFGEVDE